MAIEPKKPKIKDLVDELKTIYEGLDTVKARGHWVFSIRDLEAIAGVDPGKPLVGVLFDSGAGQENTRNQVQGVQSQGSSSLIDMMFVVIVGIPYTYGVSGDTIVDVTDVLDEGREAVLGYTETNSRGWRYSGESQIVAELEGMVFYGQVWLTSVINQGKFKK